MRSPFPGMDPHLEHPAIWPDVHNSLIGALRDALVPLLRPRYYVGLEARVYHLNPDDLVFVGRPDVAVATKETHRGQERPASAEDSRVSVLDVEIPLTDEVEETFLEIHQVETGKIVTILEILSPVNKLHGAGRQQYERKRAQVFTTQTNFVEVDLLRAGEPMPVVSKPVQSDYRILLSRGSLRPRAQLYIFGLREPIPAFPLPLLPGDAEPLVELNPILHDVYERAAYDLRLDYSQPPVPPLREEDAAWAKTLNLSGQ